MKYSYFTLAAVLVSHATLNAQPRCSTSDLNENWSFLASGQLLAIPGVPFSGPFTRTAQVMFNGQGGVSVRFERGNYAGFPVNDPYDGTYTVNTDCTVVVVVNVPPPIGLAVPFFGVLSQSKTEMQVMLSAPGVNIGGTLRKQGIYGCANSVLQGGYQIDLGGAAIATAPKPGPIRILGTLKFDGAGKFAGTVLTSINGEVAPEAWQGTYSLDFRCLLTMDYTIGTSSAMNKFEGTLIDGGKGAYIQSITNPANVVNGSLKLQ